MYIKKLNEQLEKVLNETSEGKKQWLLNARQNQFDTAKRNLKKTKQLIKKHDNIDYLKGIPEDVIKIVDNFNTQDYIDRDEYSPIEVINCIEQYLQGTTIGNLKFGSILEIDEYGMGIYTDGVEPIAKMLFRDDHFVVPKIAKSTTKLVLPDITRKPEFCKFILRGADVAKALLEYIDENNLLEG